MIFSLPKPSKVFVVETSSFQLEHVSRLRPDVAVILNIFENHLDRHASIDEYADIKLRLTAQQDPGDYFVFNGNDPHLSSRLSSVKSSKVSFGVGSNHDWHVDADKIEFNQGEASVYSLSGSEIPLLGFHNRLNSAAAAAAAHCFGADFDSVTHCLKHAKPVEHRLEFVSRNQRRSFC